MKIGCDACERAEAAVLCCADEAALCRSCDAAVHSANKLAARHHRVALLPSSTAHPTVDDGSGGGSGGHPACDICQEKTGYFFCLEDRALLCRPCDVAVHAAGVHVASHRRFLITGVRVGEVESPSHGVPVPGSDGGASPSTTSSGNGSSNAPCSSSAGGNPMTTTTTMTDQVRPPSSSSSIRATAATTTEGSPGQWLWSDFLADDVGVDMEEDCCHAELSEPGSSGLTRS